ncbi:MAG TPA: hypothetical protein VGF34_20720 [Stellaceae bacterium]|jgi:hypothetical protein
MNKTFRWLGLLALAAAIEGGEAGLALAQSATGTEPAANASGPAQGYAVGPTNAAATDQSNASQASPATELPVLYITSLEVLHTQTQPPLDIVRVTGLTGSQGWSGPQLVPTYVGKPLDGILDLQFVATMPEQTQPAAGFVPIGAVFTLEGGHQFKGVRVRASENALEVDQIPGASQASIKVDDCKDCVGKKFAEKGQAQPGAPGIVRQEDLPKVLRWIIPSRGIRGITHDPNRLNLILSSDNTIVAAYWE